MTGLCSHERKVQRRVWPKWLVLVSFIAKCPCESVSDQVILSWGWAWGGGSMEAPSTVDVRIASAFPWRTLCKPLSHYFKFEKFKYGGGGRIPPIESFVHVYSSKSLDFKYTWWMTLGPCGVISLLSAWVDYFWVVIVGECNSAYSLSTYQEMRWMFSS